MLEHAKYYLQAENDRNTHHGQVFIDILKRAFGFDEVIMVGHHFVFEPAEAMKNLDLAHLNEIPSADTIIFDHDIMKEVFGDNFMQVIHECADVPCDQRDAVLKAHLDKLPAIKEVA